MRIRMNEGREALYEDVEQATGRGHTSQALDVAAAHAIGTADEIPRLEGLLEGRAKRVAQQQLDEAMELLDGLGRLELSTRIQVDVEIELDNEHGADGD